MSQTKNRDSTIPSRKIKPPADTSGRVVQLAVDNPIITHEELAALEFEPCSHFIGFDKNPKAMEEHEEKLRSMGIMSRFSIAILGMTKAKLIETVRSMDKAKDEEVSSSAMLCYITGAREKLEAILAFVTAAEFRHASAMACVYSDDGARLPSVPKPPSHEISERQRRELGI
jgi:hypothetical protein